VKFHLALCRCLDFWKDQGRSRAQLAKEVGCSIASISHWVNNRRPIDHHFAVSLFRALSRRLTEKDQKSALVDLAAAYLDKFPDRPTKDILELLEQPTVGSHGPQLREPAPRPLPLERSNQDTSVSQAADGWISQPTISYFIAPFCLLLLIIFHSQIATGVGAVWAQIWVNGQLSTLSLAIWSFVIFVAVFFFLGLEGQGARNRAEWIEKGTWRNHYVSSVTRILDTLDVWLLSERRAKVLCPTSFSRNWSIELYEKVLLFAILYPILAVMVQWFVTGSEQAFGQLVIWPSDEFFLRRLLIFTTFVGSVPIAFFARSQERKLWQITICGGAIILNFIGYFACREFYDGVDVGAGAVNMAAIAFICGIGLKAFDNVAVPTAAASLAGATLSFAFLPILNISELLTQKPGAGYDDVDVRLVHTLLNHGMNIVLFVGFIKILSKFINRKSIETKSYFGVTIYVSAAIGTAILMFIAATQGFWTEYYLFLGLIPLLNGIFDFFSIGLTRYTLRLGSQNFGLKTVFLSIIDLILALFLFVVLTFCVIGTLLLLDQTSGGVIFSGPNGATSCDSAEIFVSGTASKPLAMDLRACPEPFVYRVLEAPTKYAWLIFIFASTLIPTVIHLGFAFFALGPALLGNGAKTTIAQWSMNAHHDLFQRSAAALAFGLWLSTTVVIMALVSERVLWLIFSQNGWFSGLAHRLTDVWLQP